MEHKASWAAMAALLLAGCAAGDPGTTGEGSSRAGQTALPGAPGGAPPSGAAGGAAPSSNDGFGNSTAAPIAPPPAAQSNTDACMVGVRCAPTEPDPDDCGSLKLEAEVEVIENPGNVLLVFDRSTSMIDDWDGNARWEEAGTAIQNALMPLTHMLTIGSVFFPSPDPDAPAICIDPSGIACIFVPLFVPSGSCAVNPISAEDQINFMPGAEFMTAFAGTGNGAPVYAPVPSDNGALSFTPLREALQQAQTALAGATLSGITSVVIITDGAPNCEWDMNTSRQIVTDWNAAGIRTHVIGLPGVQGNGPDVLNELAAAGGTGTYITTDDAAALEQKLREIATQTVQRGFDSCEITINPPAEVPDKLHLVVTEGGVDQNVARDLSEDAGWNVTADGALVTLEGRLCDDATSGRFEAIRFEFGCVDLPPLPPPPPLL